MAAEAVRGFEERHAPAKRSFEIWRSAFGMAGGDIEIVQRTVVAETGVENRSVVFEKIGLAFVIEAEGPDDGFGDGARPVADGKNPFVGDFRDGVVVRA